MNVIVAADQNWGIGYENRLLVSIPADMRFFQEETMGKVVVMGRRTFESLPNKQALINRRNIVLTGKKHYKAKGIETVHGLEEALALLRDVPDEDVYIIGGESVYRRFLPFCMVAHVTKIHYAYQADKYFPNLDEDEEWLMEYESEEQTYYDMEYTFCKYVRKAEDSGRATRKGRGCIC